MKNQLIIIGAGNVGAYLAYNIADFPDFEIIGLLDDDVQKVGKELFGYQVLGTIDQLSEIANNHPSLQVAVCIHAPQIKRTIVERIKESGLNIHFPSFISPHAWISKQVQIGQGCIIYPGVSINYESTIHDFVIMNMNCAIGHNATINNYCSFAPGVNLGGFTQMAEAVDMGIGAATKQGIQIGENAKVGGQSMLTKNVDANQTVVGVPARKVK